MTDDEIKLNMEYNHKYITDNEAWELCENSNTTPPYVGYMKYLREDMRISHTFINKKHQYHLYTRK